jgi:hypothetical protein
MSATQTTTARTIECVVPILRVENLEARSSLINDIFSL